MTTVLTGLAVSRDGSSNGTTPKGFRLAIGGMLAKNGASGVDVRKGVLWDNGGAVVSGTASMTYSVRSCNAVVMPSSTQGPIVVPNDAAINIATTAAPGSNSRIDVIWVRQHLVAADGGADSDVIGEWGVTQGTAAASPSAPAIPTGAVELARATVTTGTTATNTLTISQTHPWTVADGAPIPVRNNTERTALTAFAGMLVNNLTSGQLERYDGTKWNPVGGTDSDWVNATYASGYQTQGTRQAKSRLRNDTVRLDGLVTKTTGSFPASAATTIATLTAAHRPATDKRLPAGTSAVDQIANIGIVASSGAVQIITGAVVPSYVSLDAVTFELD